MLTQILCGDPKKMNPILSSGNGFAVLKRAVSVSARNRRIIYSVKHINSYISKKPPALMPEASTCK
jgi:hypothetical protein